MTVSFTDDGWDDFIYWAESDRNMLKRVKRLIEETMREPFGGIGKPEPLRHDLAGAWSRRIDDEHRLVYLVEGDTLVIVKARYHYS